MTRPSRGGRRGPAARVAASRPGVYRGRGLRQADLPLPGSGATWQRWAAFADIAGEDLSVVRLAEGHADAVAILAELAARRRSAAAAGAYGPQARPARTCTASPAGGAGS